jgi:hypothetical protein
MPTHTPRRAWPRLLALLSLVALAAGAGTALGRWLRQQPAAPPPGPALPDRLCTGWPRPDLALVISGEQHGYLLPCGCSRPQLGGLERRYNFLEQVRGLGWPVAAVDLGDVPQREAPAHLRDNVLRIAKYKTSMKALKLMGYSAVGIGAYEMDEIEQPLDKTINEFALNNTGAPYLLAANLDERTRTNSDPNGVIVPWKLVEPPGSGLKVGFTSIVGPSVRGAIKDKNIGFTRTTDALPAVLKEMDAAHVDVRVLLYHGSATEQKVKDWPPEAIACARNYPQFQVIVCLSDDDLAPSQPKWVEHGPGKGRTLVTSLGHKGKSVGLVGIYRGQSGEPFTLRYQMADMTESFMTPPGKENTNPILGLMEEYTQQLKETKAVSNYPQRTDGIQILSSHWVVKLVEGDQVPKYVGTDACVSCHQHAYQKWLEEDPKTKLSHSHAFQTLVDARRPSLRQYDPECIVCHTVGFGNVSGYRDQEMTPDLLNVGCESCHGPASVHVAKPKDPVWRQKLNPYKAPPDESPEARTRRLGLIDQMCQKCHDVDNDVHWVGEGFKKHWPTIEHHTPPH